MTQTSDIPKPTSQPAHWARIALAGGDSEASSWAVDDSVGVAKLSVGSSTDDGWTIAAIGVEPRHLLLDWRDGLLWVKPQAGEVRIDGTTFQGWQQLGGRCRLEFGRAVLVVDTSEAAAVEIPNTAALELADRAFADPSAFEGEHTVITQDPLASSSSVVAPFRGSGDPSNDASSVSAFEDDEATMVTRSPFEAALGASGSEQTEMATFDRPPEGSTRANSIRLPTFTRRHRNMLVGIAAAVLLFAGAKTLLDSRARSAADADARRAAQAEQTAFRQRRADAVASFEAATVERTKVETAENEKRLSAHAEQIQQMRVAATHVLPGDGDAPPKDGEADPLTTEFDESAFDALVKRHLATLEREGVLLLRQGKLIEATAHYRFLSTAYPDRKALRDMFQLLDSKRDCIHGRNMAGEPCE